LTGCATEEAVGKSPRILESGRHPKSLFAEMWNTIVAGKVWHDEVINKRKDGTFYTEEITITPVTGKAGEITHFIAVKQDVTHRLEIDRKLRESEERFRSLYENSTIGLYRTTPDGRILLANPALCDMLGYESFEELASKNLGEKGTYVDRTRVEVQRLVEEQGEMRGLESAWGGHDGSVVYVRESAKVVRDEAGKVLY